MNIHSFDLSTDGKIKLFAIRGQCTLEQVRRVIELVGADASAVSKYLTLRGLTRCSA